MADDAPRILAGRYEVGELIGRGGMAEVHIGHDTRLGRTVAIKILRSDLARDPSFQARFRREAQSAAALNHPAIVAVYDTGEEVYTEPGGAVAHVPFIVMEYVEGHTVRDILRDGHAVPIDEAVEIVSGVLSALEYSHQAGIVHRDIKPANVMITPTGAVKVMDFGIARAVADSAATMTQTQAVIGTAQYLSPEQARGESVDARSDLYSTGCLLFELLTGRPPFVGDSPVAVAYQHVREMPPRPSSLAGDVPEVLDRITLKALAKDREDRYSSAAEFHSDLEAALHGGQITAPPFAVVAAAATGAPQAELDPNATQVLGGPATQALPATWSPTGLSSSAHGPDRDDASEEKKSRKGLMWTLITIGVLAIAAIIALLVINSNREPEPTMVTVPVLEGMNAEEVEVALDEVGLVLSSRSEASEDVEEGLFVRSEPAPGAEAEEGSRVEVYFSAGPDSVTVPDVTGLSQAAARQALEDVNLEVGDVTTQTGGSVPRDQVMATDPAAGEPVAARTVVNLIVSDGQVDVPNVVGESLEDALARIDALDANISVNTIPQESEEPENQVIDQSPTAGPVTQGSRIQLTYAIPMPAELVAIPMNLVGMTQADAEAALRQLGLVPRIETDQSTDQVAGYVFGVTPPSGSQVDVGSEVTLYVSTGPGPEPTEEPTDDDDDGGGEG